MDDGSTVMTAEDDAIDRGQESGGLQPATRSRVEDAVVGDGSTALAEAGGVLICCPQAIFTSIRSPMGQGYRIVAASPGVKAEDKIEMTRRSPSHGGLCDSSADAVGLLSYPLGGGRHCVTCCVHAGVEHTARGGLRVYSHLAVLESSDFDAVAADPVRIHAVMLEGLRRNGPDLAPPPSLGQLLLEVPCPDEEDEESTVDPHGSQAQAEIEIGPEPPAPVNPAFAAIAADLEADRHVIVTGATDPMPILSALIELLPVEVRNRLSLAVGIGYSPGRRLQLVLLPDEDLQLRRLVAGQNFVIHRLP